MIIVTYDFTSNKKRAKFAKFLKKYGSRIQYSVFKIKNSERILRNIISEVECRYKSNFGNTDSVIIFKVCIGCQNKILRYGSALHEEKEILYLS